MAPGAARAVGELKEVGALARVEPQRVSERAQRFARGMHVSALLEVRVPVLGYSPNPKQTMFGCAANQTLNNPFKRFDFNGEGGAVYRQQVLLAAVDEFAYRERVHGQYNLILKDRAVQLGLPFRITVWERDEGVECPTSPSALLNHMFRVGVSFDYPISSYRNIHPSRDIGGWMWFFGLNNEADLMGDFQINSWDELEVLNDGGYRSGSHVEVKLANTGVNRYNVPPTRDPY